MNEDNGYVPENTGEDTPRNAAPGELESLRAELEAIRLGARPDCARDVVVLAGAGGGLCAENIGGVLAKYPQFKSAPLPGAPNPPGAGEGVDAFLMGFGKR